MFSLLTKLSTNNYELYYCTLKCSEFCAALATADASAVYLIKYKETWLWQILTFIIRILKVITAMSLGFSKIILYFFSTYLAVLVTRSLVFLFPVFLQPRIPNIFSADMANSRKWFAMILLNMTSYIFGSFFTEVIWTFLGEGKINKTSKMFFKYLTSSGMPSSSSLWRSL